MRSMGIKNKDLVGHAVIKECKMAMAPAILFYFFKELVGGFLNIFTATVLGKFTDAVFSLNFSFGIYFNRTFIMHGSNDIGFTSN